MSLIVRPSPFSMKHAIPGISSSFRGYVSTAMSDLPQINVNTLIVNSGATINEATITTATIDTLDVETATTDLVTATTGIFLALTATDIKTETMSGTTLIAGESTIGNLVVTSAITLPSSISSNSGAFEFLEAKYAGITNLTGINLSYTTITGINILNTDLVNTNATITTLTGTTIKNTDLTSTNSLITTLTGTTIKNINLTSTNTTITTLTGTTINTSTLNFPATTGDKIILYPTISDYAIGIDANRMYFNVNGVSDYSEFRNAGVGKTRITNSTIEPVTTSTIDLGTSALYFNNGHVNYINSTNITGTTINSTNSTATTLTSTNSTITNLTSTNITGTNIRSTNSTLTNITGVSNLNSTNLILGSSANKTTIVATTPSSARTLTVPDPGASANLLLSSTLSNTQTTNSRLDFTQGANNAMMSYAGGVGNYFFYTNTITGTRRARLPETGYEQFNDFIMAEGAQTLNNKTLTNATLTGSTLSSANSTITNATITNLTGTSARITTITGVSTLNSVTIDGVTNLNSTNATITSITGVTNLSFGSFSALKRTFQVTVAAADLRSMFTTPVTILPALAGRIHLLQGGVANCNSDGTAYAGGGGIRIRYSGTSIEAIDGTAIAATILTASPPNQMVFFGPPESGPSTSSSVINKDIVITNEGAAFTSGGNSTLIVFFEVISIIGN